MRKAVRVPSDVWEKRVLKGVDENGEKVYEIFRGESEEEVNAKARDYARKKKLKQQNAWQAENKDRLSVVFDKGTKERIERSGMATSGFIREAVENELARRGL